MKERVAWSANFPCSFKVDAIFPPGTYSNNLDGETKNKEFVNEAQLQIEIGGDLHVKMLGGFCLTDVLHDIFVTDGPQYTALPPHRIDDNRLPTIVAMRLRKFSPLEGKQLSSSPIHSQENMGVRSSSDNLASDPIVRTIVADFLATVWRRRHVGGFVK